MRTGWEKWQQKMIDLDRAGSVWVAQIVRKYFTVIFFRDYYKIYF